MVRRESWDADGHATRGRRGPIGPEIVTVLVLLAAAVAAVQVAATRGSRSSARRERTRLSATTIPGAVGIRWTNPDARRGGDAVQAVRVQVEHPGGWRTAAQVDASDAVAIGQGHVCVLRDDATVACWGWNGAGSLGEGNTRARGDRPGQMGDRLPAVDLGTDRRPIAITAGSQHVCVLLDDGTVRCWGGNRHGELGVGDRRSRGDQPGELGGALVPVDLGTGRTAMAISAGAAHTCALLDDGTVRCWGANRHGELGLGDRHDRGDQPGEMGDALRPVDLGADRHPIELRAARHHTCVRFSSGEVSCWGRNRRGELGTGDVRNRGDGPGEMGAALTTVDLAGRRAVRLSGGGLSAHTCAVLDDGALRCWGHNQHGQLGLGDTNNRGDQPGETGTALPDVDLGRRAVVRHVTTDFYDTCALLADDTVRCWGYNAQGEVGVGDRLDRGDGPGEMGAALPSVQLGSTRRVAAVTSGGAVTCAVFADGSLGCWGLNSDGELGLGDTRHRGASTADMGAGFRTVELGTGRTVATAGAAVVGLAPGRHRLRLWAVDGRGTEVPLGRPFRVAVPG